MRRTSVACVYIYSTRDRKRRVRSMGLRKREEGKGARRREDGNCQVKGSCPCPCPGSTLISFLSVFVPVPDCGQHLAHSSSLHLFRAVLDFKMSDRQRVDQGQGQSAPGYHFVPSLPSLVNILHIQVSFLCFIMCVLPSLCFCPACVPG